MDNRDNGTTPSDSTCPARKTPADGHCWHSSSSPIINPNVTATFPSLCCFCAPSYLHLEVYVLAMMPDTEVLATQMLHGPLLTVRKRPAGPGLLVPRG